MPYSFQKLKRAVSRADEMAFRIGGSFTAPLFWRRLATLSRSAGIRESQLILSFDCDTTEDSEVVLKTDGKLRELGIHSAYAVPGELLIENEKIYATLRDRGAEFLNHGYRRHTLWNAKIGHNVSTFFYDQVPYEMVEEDIHKGHDTLVRFLGTTPMGFRAPHFGTFQSRRQLGFLYGLLRVLGYRFSSSTLPCFGFRRGPLYDVGGLKEIPVSGSFSRPAQPFDSWSYFQAPGRRLSPKDFKMDAERMANFCAKSGFTCVLNYYVDPSHVADSPEFFEAMKALAAAVKSTTFNSLLNSEI